MKKLGLLLLVSVLAANGIIARVLSNHAYYLIGTGTLAYTSAFLLKPAVFVIALASCSFAVYAIGRLRLAKTRPAHYLLVCVASLAVSFLCMPSWRTSDRHLCSGLEDRLRTKHLEKSFVTYLESLIASASNNANSNTLKDVTEGAPDWLKSAFPDAHLRISLCNAEVKYIRLQAGGPYLRYGCYVGLNASDMPDLADSTVVVTVASNILVFAQ